MDNLNYNNNYDAGINDDPYSVWRNAGDIGYVQLAFKVVTEAIYDLIAGDHDLHTSASYFFFGKEGESLYWTLWAKILGRTELPDIVLKHQRGQVSQQDVEDIRNMCTTIKTI